MRENSKSGVATTLPKLLSCSEVAEYLGITESTLSSWRYKGVGPRYLSTGSRIVRYSIDDVAEWVESRTSRGAA